MYAAITKKKLGENKPYFLEQAFTKEEALRAYTIWGAYVSKQENVTGSIEVGKWADFTFIDIDVLNASPEKILKGKKKGRKKKNQPSFTTQLLTSIVLFFMILNIFLVLPELCN